MKTNQFKWAGGTVAVLLGCLALMSCATAPRKLPPMGGAGEPETDKDYLHALKDSPEMFPRELSRPAREELLLLNWAMMKAVESGKLKVRMIAPPLQLTGDLNVDRALTHQVLLLADDLKPGESFLDVYEVRVGPPSALFTVRPAAAAESLAVADKIYAEEQLTRLRLDKQTLSANAAFATNYAPVVTSYLAEAGVALTNRLKGLENLLTRQTNDLNSVSNNVAASILALTQITTNMAALKAKPEDQTVKDELAELKTKLGAETGKHAELVRVRDRLDQGLRLARMQTVEAEQQFRSTSAIVDKMKREPALLDSYIKALNGLEDFWKDQMAGNAQLSALTAAAHVYPMNTAVTISFRAEALHDLPQITIDVLRKVRAEPVHGEPSSNLLAGISSTNALLQALKEVKARMPEFNGLLLAEDRRVEAGSRWRQLKVKRDELQEATGALEAQILREPTNAPGANTNIVAVNLKETLGKITTDLATLNSNLTEAAVKSDRGRNTAADTVTHLRGLLAKAVVLAGGINTANPVGGGAAGASGNDDAKTSLIKRGDLAVFRLNVLRGVVSTTAFLLPDDGSAQLFGHAFADQFFAAQVTFRNPYDKAILIYGNTLRLVVRMNVSNPGKLSEDGQFERKKFWATYEPLDYDAVRRMLEGVQDNSWQRWASKGIDLAQMAGGAWAAFAPSKDVLKGIGLFGAFTPKAKELLEADLKRNALNFRDKGLNSIEEIAPQGTLTRYVFLPKGPIYGTYAADVAVANELPLSSQENRWAPFSPGSKDFGKRALQPAYIHDIRREEVYVEGKRILTSDPLTPTGSK